jgi:hypothetical protein
MHREMFGLKWHHGVTLSWKASKWVNYRESEDELDKLTDQVFQGIIW